MSQVPDKLAALDDGAKARDARQRVLYKLREELLVVLNRYQVEHALSIEEVTGAAQVVAWCVLKHWHEEIEARDDGDDDEEAWMRKGQ